MALAIPAPYYTSPTGKQAIYFYTNCYLTQVFVLTKYHLNVVAILHI